MNAIDLPPWLSTAETAILEASHSTLASFYPLSAMLAQLLHLRIFFLLVVEYYL